MKKNYLNCLAILLCCVYSFKTHGQSMAGVYTIDNTLLASTNNFTSFTACALRLNTFGVTGPVTINVGNTSGPYVEQVTFNQATGISATNTITINGNGRTITFNSTSSTAPHTILLNGADYMTFNDLIITGQGTTYALSMHLWNAASFNQFTNCKINAPIGGTNATQVPFSMSGSATSAVTNGDHGNSNIVNTCTISGGYYNTVLYGMTGSPYNTGNQILNSYMVDWYMYGLYQTYDRNFLIKGNIVERLNLTTTSTTYGMYFSNVSPNAIIEGNHVRKLFEMMLTNGSTCYPFYFTSSGGQVNNEMLVRNNIVSDIRFNGALYGFYAINGSYYAFDHNTISLDDANSTYAGQTIGFQYYCQYFKIRNNIISMKRGGTINSRRIGIAVGSPVYLTGFVSKNNVFNIAGTTGANSIGSNSVFYNTLPAWQVGVNQDLTSIVADPGFTTFGSNYTPTSLVINNTASPLGLTTDYYNNNRSLVMPDPGAIEFYNSACTSGPGTTSITAPTASVCPGSVVELVLGSNTFTNSGYSVQWYSSTTSSLTGYSSIANATLNSFTTLPATANTYYNAIVTCTNSMQSSTTSVGSVLVAQTASSTVPYYESFETLAYNGLPNCSWSNTQGNVWPNFPAATFLQSNNRVPRTGNGYAVFTGTPVATNYFYSNGIWMEPGITYSASIWYINESLNYNPWTDISLMLGTSQSPSTQTLLASSNGPVASVLYSALTNTFIVGAPAYYYVAVKGVSAAGSSPFLTLDDLSITIPCSLNEPVMSITSTNDTICDGESVTLTANGAVTYSWSNGAGTQSITVNPSSNASYMVMGTNTLSGCSSSVATSIVVNQLPSISVFAIPVAVCAGGSANLVAAGANVNTYAWSNGQGGSSTMVTPTATTVYSVTATSINNCIITETLQVQTFSIPTVTASATRTNICKGESTSLSAGGATTYSWAAFPSGQLFQGAGFTDSPGVTTSYTVTGTDINGCKNTAIQSVGVDPCTGLKEGLSGALKVYPNPAHQVLNIDLGHISAFTSELSDVTGRVILHSNGSEGRSEISLEGLSNGIYYLRIQSVHGAEIIKVIKN